MTDLESVQRYGPALKHISEQTREICLAAVNQDGNALIYVKEQTPEICLAAVSQDGYALKHVKNQTPEICLAAVKRNSDALVYVKDQTPGICLEAVKCGPVALKFVKDQTPEICLASVKRWGWSLQYVKKQTREICLAAIELNGHALMFVRTQTPEICLIAVKCVGYALKYVKEQTPEICLAAVKQNGFSLEYVHEQTQEICLAAVQQNGLALEYVKEQTLEICLEAVKQNSNAFKFVLHEFREYVRTVIPEYQSSAELKVLSQEDDEIRKVVIARALAEGFTDNDSIRIYVAELTELDDDHETDIWKRAYNKIISQQEKKDKEDFKMEPKIIKIKYFTDKIDKLAYIDGKSDWIDLRAAVDVDLKAGEYKLIPLGVGMKLPEGYEAHIVPRSSTFKNYGIIQTNHQGVIDSSYFGDNDQWHMPVYALRDTHISVNDRICQFRIVENQPTIMFEEVKVLEGKNRGGFGSTGKQ